MEKQQHRFFNLIGITYLRELEIEIIATYFKISTLKKEKHKKLTHTYASTNR
jgi:hypothetical protein